MDILDIKLLYVEDEEIFREETLKVLEYKNIKQIFTATNGFEALQVYEQEKPDIIITDLNMPKMDGINFILNVRAKDTHTKVIMLTAKDDIDTLLKATELHLTKYLLKPLDYGKLFDAIDLAVTQIQDAQENSTKVYTLDKDFVWDYKKQELYHKQDEVSLTPKERKILELLLNNLDSTLDYDTIICEVWEDSDTYSLDNLKTMIKNIRKKLPENTIENVFGTGFRIKKNFNKS